MKRFDSFTKRLIFLILFCSTLILILPNICHAQSGWPIYTQNVLLNPLIDYIQDVSMPGSVIVSGCWGYPWFAVPGGNFDITNAWSSKSYYMFYPPLGWFDAYLYPFWHIYNVADPFRDFPNFSVLTENPATWMEIPQQQLWRCQDPICYYLGGGIHFFSGAVQVPNLILERNNPSIDVMLIRYLGLMGLFDYNVPPGLAVLPIG